LFNDGRVKSRERL